MSYENYETKRELVREEVEEHMRTEQEERIESEAEGLYETRWGRSAPVSKDALFRQIEAELSEAEEESFQKAVDERADEILEAQFQEALSMAESKF